MNVLFCKCAKTQLVLDEIKDSVLGAVQAAGLNIVIVDDLCGLAATGNIELFSKWADDDELAVVACYPRAVRSIFAKAGVTLKDTTPIYNLRVDNIDKMIASLTGKASGGLSQMQEINCDCDDWQPWYPVIDYKRCINCKQCVNFCLFGVYALEDNKVKVVRPASCKTGCPACARVCPEGAIIFAKYGDSPINGDEVNDAEWKEQVQKPDIHDRMVGNVHDILRNRGKVASQETPHQAIKGIDLKRLQKEFDIPDHVIESLEDEME